MRKLLLLTFLLWFARATFAGSAYILCYHTFLSKPQFSTDFSISEFRSQIQELQSAGFKFVQWKDIVQNKIKGKKNILVVIDDGNISTFPAYTQVLKPLGIKPMVALYPGIIGSRKFALTWEQVKSMQADGLEIASHGYFHMYFSQKYHDSNPKEFKDEIFLSKKILSDHLGQPIHEIVYPFGVSSEVAKQMIHEAGYLYAFSLRQAALVTPVSPGEALDIPRFMITRGEKRAIFEQIIKETSR